MVQTSRPAVSPAFDVADAIRRLRALGGERLAIFGGGSNTRALLYALGPEARAIVDLIFDDGACEAEISGIPVMRPMEGVAIDRIVITSPAHAARLADRARAVFGAEVPLDYLFERAATLAGRCGEMRETLDAEWPVDVDDALWHNADALASGLRRKLESAARWRYGVSRQLAEFHGLRRDLDAHVRWSGCRFYNFGCGRYHPLGLSLLAIAAGAERTLATDLEPPLETARAGEALAELAGVVALDPSAALGERVDVAAAAARIASVVRVGALRSGRLREGIDATRLALRAESIYDAVLAPERFDAIVSRAVFEHLPDVPGALRALCAALTPGGVMTLRIDFADHRCYVDPGRYRHWSHLIDLDEPAYLGTNRLRYPDYPPMFERAGLRVITWRPETRAAVPTEAIAKLAPRYRAMSADDLAVMSATAVLGRG